MILDVKPHKISYLTASAGYEDENGDYHEGGNTWSEWEPCNAVPSGKANEKQFEDGVVRQYSYTVGLSPDCHEFAIGDKVKLLLTGDAPERTYEVKGFHRYQHSAKLWL